VVPDALAVGRDERVEVVRARRHGPGHLEVGGVGAAAAAGPVVALWADMEKKKTTT